MKFKIPIKGQEHMVDMKKRKIVNLETKKTRKLNEDSLKHFENISKYYKKV